MVVRYNHQRKGSFDIETKVMIMGIILAKRLSELSNPSTKLIFAFIDVAINFDDYDRFIYYLRDNAPEVYKRAILY